MSLIHTKEIGVGVYLAHTDDGAHEVKTVIGPDEDLTSLDAHQIAAEALAKELGWTNLLMYSCYRAVSSQVVHIVIGTLCKAEYFDGDPHAFRVWS